jgi:hypothetical protein
MVTDGPADQVDAVAWLRRQDRWDRRLRALEGAAPTAVPATEPSGRPSVRRPVTAP